MSRDTSWSGDRIAFPPDVKVLILERDGHRCVAALDDGTRCPVTEPLYADHIVNVAEARLLGWSDAETHSPDNGQALCDEHHDAKTRAEIKRGQQRWQANRPKRRRPPERHPGLL